MQIQVITSTIETKPTAKGSYQQLELVYKNLTFQNKVESKKLMSFGAGAGSFVTLSTAQSGSNWDIEVTKNDKGYNDWVGCTESNGAVPAQAPATAAGRPAPAATTTAPRSNYETPEERAQRQVLIVRQSSLSAAVATLSVGAKALKPADVIALANEYVGFVFDLKPAADKGPSGFADVPDFDMPEVN